MFRPTLLAVLALPSLAAATETTLIAMPIADVLGHREGVWTLTANGHFERVKVLYSDTHGIELGLGDRIEFGYDNDFLGATVLNAKLQVGSGKNWAMAVGVNGFTPGGTSVGHYVVGRLDFASFRLHAGVMRDNEVRAEFGIDGALPHGWAWMLEYISGNERRPWAAVNIPIGANLTLALQGGIPCRKGEQWEHGIGLTAGFRF